MTIRTCEFCEEQAAVIEDGGRFFCGFDCWRWHTGQLHRESERRDREAQR